MTKQVFTLPAQRPARLVVLISGGGSNLVALAQACTDPHFGAEVVGVVADRQAAGLQWARDKGIPTACLPLEDFPNRESWDEKLAQTVVDFQADLVVSAGFLKILGPRFLAAFPNRVVNTHNSLLPAFPGIHGPRDALRSGVKLAGATLFVVDPGMDTGPILAQVAVEVREEDTEATLTERIKTAERAQLIQSIEKMVQGGWWVEANKAGFESHPEQLR